MLTFFRTIQNVESIVLLQPKSEIEIENRFYIENTTRENTTFYIKSIFISICIILFIIIIIAIFF